VPIQTLLRLKTNWSRWTRTVFFVAAMLACSSMSFARPLEDARAAYTRGDYATALRLYRKAADQGQAAAQYSLGVLYANGQGVPQNYTEAVNWYRKAADQGQAAAQYNLGVLYANGQGVPQNYTEAMNWFRKAADQGQAEAQHNLGLMYANGQGVPQDYVLGYMWFNLAAAQGYKDAVGSLAWLEARMTPAQIAEAQRLAQEWKPSVVKKP
jgi:uncharacterized protein